MKAHKYAQYFPEIEGEEYEQLVADIKEFGLLEPIVVHEGEILDGMNRYRACKDADVEPQFIEMNSGADPLDYVISMNVRRRHLSDSQKAMIATEMEKEFAKEAKKRQASSLPGGDRKITRKDGKKQLARDEAASAFGISGPTVQRAKRIKAQAPERVDDIIRGKTTVGAVDAELRERAAAERAAAKKEKADDKAIKEHPKVVKEYLDATATFRDAIKLALKAAKRDRFSPEAGAFVIRRHNDIRRMLDELEEILQ